MADTNVRVIGAGCGRTGTMSLKKALEILEFGPCYHMTEVFANGDCASWSKYVDNTRDHQLLHSMLGGKGYCSTCDFPTSMFWKEQLDLYPNAKVILTARDPEKWYKSCCDTIFQVQPSHPDAPLGIRIAMKLGFPVRGMGHMLEKLFYGHFMPNDWSKAAVLQTYKAHNDDVLRTCPKDKLLVFEVSQGWAPLCEFLHVPIPDVPFPHVNDTEHFQQQLVFLNAMGYGVVAAAVTAVALVGWRLAK